MRKYGILWLMMGMLMMGCKSKIIQYPVSYEDDRSKFMQFSQDRNKLILAEDNELIEQYIDSIGQAFSRTSYGFWISNSGKSTETMAKVGDYVQYEYEVFDFSNELIYSKEELGVQDGVLGRMNLPRGLHVTLQLIEKGDSATALYPSFMGYDNYGDQNKIGSHVPLIFKVKMLDIKKKENIK